LGCVARLPTVARLRIPKLRVAGSIPVARLGERESPTVVYGCGAFSADFPVSVAVSNRGWIRYLFLLLRSVVNYLKLHIGRVEDP